MFASTRLLQAQLTTIPRLLWYDLGMTKPLTKKDRRVQRAGPPGRRFRAATSRNLDPQEAATLAAQAELLRDAVARAGLSVYALSKATSLALATTQNALLGVRTLPPTLKLPGGHFPTKASAHVYSSLALALGLSVDQVESVGREDAAELMRQALAVDAQDAARDQELSEKSARELTELIAEAAEELRRRAKVTQTA